MLMQWMPVVPSTVILHRCPGSANHMTVLKTYLRKMKWLLCRMYTAIKQLTNSYLPISNSMLVLGMCPPNIQQFWLPLDKFPIMYLH